MRIREYDEAQDLGSLRRCIIELQNFERTFDPRLPEGASIADRWLKQMLEECRTRRGKIFVADDEGAVVGYACVCARVRSSDISEGPREYALVSDLVVLGSHRNRGIGRSLLARSESYARDQGAPCLRISVLAANRAARAMYAGHGFEEHEIILEKTLTSE